MFLQHIKTWIVFPALLAGGVCIGLMVPFSELRSAVAHVFELEAHDDHADEEPEESMHVEITKTAQKNIGLKVRRAEIVDYQSVYEIPSVIKELPSATSLSIASRFSGLIRKVFVSEGQSIRAGDPIFEMDLTGEVLSKAQSDLLLAIKKNENVQKEIDRLAPLVQQGGVANKQYLELTYQQNQLNAEIDTKEQELLLHGLTSEHITSIRQTKKLVRTVQIKVPENLLPPLLNQANAQLEKRSPTFILETLSLKPGSMAEEGDKLCELAFHEILVIEGHAYEKDIRLLQNLFENNTPLDISIGSDTNETVVANCSVAYISNHAQESTNTFPFFVYLNNELTNPSAAISTPRYMAWKWKPGQLGHIKIPNQKFEKMIVVPRDAVAEDGISKLVFKWNGEVQHDHEEEEDHDHDHEHPDEYEPVEVNVIFIDQHFAVIDPTGQLKPGTRIAINNANQLLFAMQTGGGHGHSHPHPH